MRYIKSFANDSAIQEAVDNKTLGKPYVALNESAGTIDWNGKDIDYSKMYLTIEALSGGTFYVRKANVGYSVNGADWETTTGETTLSLNQGDEVRFKGTAGGKGLFSGNTLAFNAYGNVESLEYGDNYIGQTNVQNSYAFEYMFRGCTNLVTAPALPATDVRVWCYHAMFSGCTSLTTVPELPATALTKDCYYEMFTNCTSLSSVQKVLPAKLLKSSSYANMFQNCTNLTTAPEILASAGGEACLQGMFYGCTNLTTAPILTIEALPEYGCSSMFSGCTNLNYIKCLATSKADSDATMYWVLDVQTVSGTFVKDPSVRVGTGHFWTRGIGGVPDNWTVVDAS